MRRMRERIAFFICPTLKDEIAALRSGNTKVVLENARLMDEAARSALAQSEDARKKGE